MLDPAALDALFFKARTHNAWQDRAVDEADLRRAFDCMRMAPTAANGQPARFVWLRSEHAKARLRPLLLPGNVEKTMAAPVVVIVAYDTEFQEYLPRLFPHLPGARAWFDGEPNRAVRLATAVRNSSLQGAYLMLALRAVGLDCGPMSGFDAAALDAEFFADGRLRSNFLINVGYGDPAGVFPRGPRFEFDEVSQVL
jgi:3-hydroxypropanoate dehydrogenase